MAQELFVAGGDERLALSEKVFGQAYNETLVHQVVTAARAAGRAGTKQQKNRSDVSGGGKKPWRQKGTGRARAGTIRSPIWAGGGVTFAARPRAYDQKVNRKMYRGAMRSMLSALFDSSRLSVIADLDLEARSTKGFIQALAAREAQEVDLVIVDGLDDVLDCSARNVARTRVVAVSALTPVDLVVSERVAMTASAKTAIEEWLG